MPLGVHRTDCGTVRVDGEPSAPAGPAAAMRAEIATVHQGIEDGVIADLDVASGLLLDRLAGPARGPGRRAGRRARWWPGSRGRWGSTWKSPARCASSGTAERQPVAIARVMARDPRVLILDDPTSSLSAAKAKRLVALIERLRASGVAIHSISHRSGDIRRVADRIVAMRDGVVTGAFEDAPFDLDGAVTAMPGQVMEARDRLDAEAGPPAFDLALRAARG